MEEKRRLYIPVQIRKEKQVAEGFGAKEAGQLLAATGACAGATALLSIAGVIPAFWIILVSVMVAGAGGIFLRKNTQDMNILDIVQYMLEFAQSQKRYCYEYVNPYEKEVIKPKESKPARAQKDGAGQRQGGRE